MSWLASLIISGLIMSNFGGSSSSSAPSVHIDKASVRGEQTAADYQGDLQDGQQGEETERFDQTYPFSSNGSVALSNLNGNVTIETWERNEVRVEYTKTATTKEMMDWVRVHVNATKERIEIEADYDNWKDNNNGSWEKWKNKRVEVTFKLTVPRSAILNEIETVNGSVFLSNMTNFCKVSTVNGEVTARNLRGAANLSTVNGNLIADFDRLENNNQISLNTVNGRVILTIPSDSDATLKADTVNGSIANDFGLPVRKGEYVGRDLYGKIGNGTTKIKLSSVNGGLSVVRRQDGKALSPATNLLQIKKDDVDNDNDDDNDEDNDDDSDNRSRAAMSRDVERAVRDAIKTVPKAMADANVNVQITEEMLKEIAKVQKEVTRVTVDQTKIMDGQVKAALLDTQNALSGIYVLPGTSVLPSLERQGETIAVKGTPKVIVEAKNCAVIVRGWDRPEVKYTLTKVNRSIQIPAGGGLNVEKDDSRVKIKVTDTNQQNRYRLEVFVPKKSNLKISTDKEIRLDGVSGDLELSTPSDAISVHDSDGKLNAATVNGQVRVIGFQGEVNSATVDGTISLEGTFTKFSANAGNGTLVLTLPDNTGAYIATPTDNVFAEGLSIAKENDRWKVGKGGDIYNIQSLSEGKIVIRSAAGLRAGL
jgi:DUF4097 and DUF4098 domain-containing protein YvlB